MKICANCGSPFSNDNVRCCSRACYLAMAAKNEEARFWAKVQKTSGCWVWQAKRNENGYGQFWAASQRHELAHRTSWRLAHGHIPTGLLVCHRCDNTACVRPDHLFLGTDLDNSHDCIRKGRAPNRSGERNANTRMTQSDVDRLRRKYVPGKTRLVDLAREFGISTSHVSHIVNGRSKTPWKEPDKGIANALLSFGT